MNTSTETIYIVLTQTGTILSTILKIVTRAKYNHSSVSLKKDLSAMYSFGRRKPYNPFVGGFVEEAPDRGLFKRFPKTDALIIAVDITKDQYMALDGYLNEMCKTKNEYRYNYAGVFWAMFDKPKQYDKRYYCSEFVKEVLIKYDITPKDKFPDIVKPIDMINIVGGNVIFSGKLKDYTNKVAKNQ